MFAAGTRRHVSAAYLNEQSVIRFVGAENGMLVVTAQRVQSIRRLGNSGSMGLVST